jgi:hypothetical protein
MNLDCCECNEFEEAVDYNDIGYHSPEDDKSNAWLGSFKEYLFNLSIVDNLYFSTFGYGHVLIISKIIGITFFP